MGAGVTARVTMKRVNAQFKTGTRRCSGRWMNTELLKVSKADFTTVQPTDRLSVVFYASLCHSSTNMTHPVPESPSRHKQIQQIEFERTPSSLTNSIH